MSGSAARKQDDEWLTTRSAADYAKMSLSAFKMHIARGRIVPDSPARPGFKEHRFLRSTVDRWLTGS